MNDFQAAQQIQYLLRTLAWEDSPYEAVFDPASVLVTGGVLIEALPAIRPVVMILPGDHVADPEFVGLGVTNFPVRVVHTRQDERGEAILLGGNLHPTGGTGSSQGRGLLEYVEQARRRLERLDGSVGMKVAGFFVGSPETSYEADYGYVAARTVRIGVDTTRAPYYAPPQRLVSTPAGGGSFSVTTTWALPADRFDFHAESSSGLIKARGRIILRRRQGLVAPTGPTDGVGVTLSGDFATSVTEVVTAVGGAYWTYGVFAAYDESPDFASEGTGVTRYSDASAVGTYRTVQTS